MQWRAIVKNENNTITIPDSWLYLHYYEALNVLFRIENALRIFVYAILKNEFQESWSDLSISSDDSQTGTINSIAKQRIKQATDFGYLGYSINCPIVHLTSGELIRIIVSDHYWKYFAKHFNAKKEIVKNKLDEIGIVRNSLAHFRPLKLEDVEIVKQNAGHILEPINAYITNMLSTDRVVPTNTIDEWYKKLNNLKSESCKFSLYQSKEGEWIRISIRYNCEIIHERKIGSGYLILTVLNLLTPSLINEMVELKKFATFITEFVMNVKFEDQKPIMNKTINFIFNSKIIKENHESIKEAFEQLIQLVETERKLIESDQFARGRVVEATRVTGIVKDKTWKFNTDNLSCKIANTDPTEYWGEFSFNESEFISQTDKYPWMPVTISDTELPF